ncbi:MAG: response regulator [Bdellovibrionia bacterium]
MLEAYGAKVKTAESAAQAMQEFTRFNPDILVSDIAMPEEDGYSLIHKIRDLKSKHSKVPAIALTAYAGVEDWRRALDAGFNRHIAKPVDEYELMRSIAELAGRDSKL